MLIAALYDRPSFSSDTLLTDEVSFTRDRIFNSRSYIWTEANPCATVVRSHQVRFAVNMWAAIANDYIIGPYLLPCRLTAAVYTVFLRGILPLEHVPLDVSPT